MKFLYKNSLEKLEEYDIATVTWTIFYDSDETHFEDDPDVVDINGKAY